MSLPERPGRSDGDQTRARVLEAAGALIAQRGFADTPNKLIAQAAGVDQASINYHFGTRNGLYQATLVEAHRRVITLDRLQDIDAGGGSPAQKIRHLIEAVVDSMPRRDGWHAAIFARELLSPSPNLQVLMTDEVLPKIALLQRFIAAYTGIPEGHPALARCVVSVVAPCLMLMIAGRGLPGPVHQTLRAPRAELVEHLYAFSVAGLKAVASGMSQRAARRPRTGGAAASRAASA